MAADVSIRFSAQNAEVVRQALQALGKDGEKALQQLNTASQGQNRGLKALSTIADELKSRVMGLAVSIGPAGQALIQLGPAGLAVAAGFGALVSLFSAASERAKQFGERARDLIQSAEALGLAVEQVHALQRAGASLGLEGNRVTAFFERMTSGIEELRRGTGPLFEALARVDAELVHQITATRDNATAINVLVKAYQRMDVGQRALLVGSRNLRTAEIFRLLGDHGGLTDYTNELARLGRVMSTDVANGAAASMRRLEELDKEWDRQINRILGVRDNLERMIALAELRNASGGALSNLFGGDLERQRQINQLIRQRNELQSEGIEILRKLHADTEEQWRTENPDRVAELNRRYLELTAQLDSLRQQYERLTGVARTPPAPAPGAPPPGPAGTDGGGQSAAADLALMRRWTGVLGEAITLSEQRRQRELELSVALSENRINQEQYNRALAEFGRQQQSALILTRQRFGVATEEEIVQQRLAELYAARARGIRMTAEEIVLAERIIRREAEDTANALRVRASETPALTRLQIDAADLSRTLDTNLAGALRGSTQSILDMAKGTKTLSQGFAELTERILDAIAQALIMRTIVGPIAGAIAGGFGSVAGGGANPWGAFVIPSARGNVFAGGRLQAFRAGGVVTRPTIFPMAGGMGLMGEAGPEAVLPLRRLGGGRLGVEASGASPTVLVQIVNNHPTARVSQREEDDGRGGRKMVAVIEEIVATAVARPGSRVPKALGAAGAMTRL